LIGRLGQATRVDRVRRNHALEHAAITIVSERYPDLFLRGRSNSRGFYIFGDISTEELHWAVDQALQRLRAGEAELAIHPRCGTNLAVAGVLTGLSAALAAQLRPRQNRFSYAILASLASLMVAPQLGESTQRHVTTLAEMGSLRVDSIDRRSFPFLRDPTHFVKTSYES
jgi:hypothetical protein